MGKVEHVEQNQNQNQGMYPPPEYRTHSNIQNPPMVITFYQPGPAPQSYYPYGPAAPPTYQTNAPDAPNTQFVPAQPYQQPQQVYIYTNQLPYQQNGAVAYVTPDIDENRYKRLVQDNPTEIGVIAALGACLACCCCVF
ncbi:hypothetical protein IWW45_007675 [Coemansia sp. RSA 485]|nr:hypothetical protein IWW45_007675 [Coemansia sp. RSA 485]